MSGADDVYVRSGWKADISATDDFAQGDGPNRNGGRFAFMPHDADYYRARAMEERERAQHADRVYLAKIHRELAEQLDRRAEECDGVGEQLTSLQSELPS